MTNNGLIPIGKKTISSVEYFAFQSGLQYIIARKITTSGDYAIDYFIANKADFTTAWTNPSTGITYASYNQSAEYINIITLLNSTIASGSGGGDASAANQVTGNTSLSNIDTDLGAKADSAASSDTGTFSLIALTKRLLSKIPGLGQTTMSGSQPVTIASDQSTISVSDFSLGLVSTQNSTTTLLGSNGVFTGTSQDVSVYSEIRVSVFTDQPSATNGLSIQFSKDGTNWDFTDVYTIAASTGGQYVSPVYAQFFRIVYTNGGVAQGIFRLSSLLRKNHGRGSAIRPQDTRSNEIDTEEMSTYLMLYNGTTWDRARGTITEGQYVTQIDKTVTCTITTQNLNATGVGTAGSYVGFTNLNGASSASIQVSGTYTGALTVQESIDGTNWQAISDGGLGVIQNNTANSTILSASTGIFKTRCNGSKYFRVTALAAVTGTATITIQVSSVPNNSNGTFLLSGLPAGGNTIGNIGTIGTSVTPGTGATNLGKSRNLAIGATDTGVGVLTLRNDTLATFGTTGNYNTPIADKYGSLVIKNQQRHKRTYSTSFVVTPAASATDIVQMIGSATTTVSIQKIIISGTQTTGGLVNFILAKRSTANTGGTSTAATLVPHDSGDAAATTVISNYTVNPTSTGTLVGNIRTLSIPIAGTAATTNDIVEINFAERGKPIVLNGVAQALAINLNGVTITGGSINICIEFTEE